MKRYDMRFDHNDRLDSIGVLISLNVQLWIEETLPSTKDLEWSHGLLRMTVSDAAFLANAVMAIQDERSLNDVEFAVFDCLVTRILSKFGERGVVGFLAEHSGKSR